jgi:threonyl-tRNA synthetase
MLSTIIEFISILKKIYHAFGFECIKVCLATRPKEFAGTIENWGKAEKVLETAAREGNLELSMNPGDGAFYGPKLEFYLEDSRKRIWQCGTVQVDFVLPNRLTATYITSENKKEFPVIIHHAVLGTIERFLGILLEHTKGQLPFWLCPLQIIIIPIHEDHLSYSEQLRKLLDSRGFISEIDKSQETLSYKIRKLWKQDKIPVIAVLGDQEVHNGTVSIRIRGKDVYNGLTIEEFIVKMEDMGRILE